MKLFSIIIIFSILTTSTYSQPFGDAMPQYRIVKIVYENASGAKETTVFRYNSQNKIDKANWAVNDSSRYSHNYYEYDVDGNLVSAFRDFSDGITSFERFNYDSSGNKVSEYFFRSDGITGYSVHYYENNQLINSNLFKHKGWLNGKLEIKYNAQNKRERGVLLKEQDTLGIVYYYYDRIGNLYKEYWDFNGKWSQTFNYTYKKIEQPSYFYTSPFLSVKNGYRICKEYYNFNNEKGGPSNYYYDDNNLLIRKDFIRSDSLKTTTYYKYDGKRKLLVSRRLYSDEKSEIFSYIYDENENLVNRNCYKADTLYGFESYLYNSDNVLICAYLKNFDGWLSGTVIFKSDEFGKISEGKFTGETGFNATLHFYYNSENLISKIKWDFSFGKFQEYIFEYE